MWMQAQAERERQAKPILGNSERQIAEKFEQAAKSYVDNPAALHLRAMNMLYEGLKQNATIVLVPSTAVDSMQFGGLAGVSGNGNGAESRNDRTKAPQKQPLPLTPVTLVNDSLRAARRHLRSKLTA